MAGFWKRFSTATRAFGREFRSSTSTLRDPTEALLRLFGSRTAAGVNVTPENAMQVTAVLACVKVLAESLASLPLKVYRKTADGRDEAPEHPAYHLVKDEPNGQQSSFEFREMLQGHLALRGNAYAFIERDAYFQPTQLIPLKPHEVQVMRRDDGTATYRYQGNDFRPEQILHLRGLSSDGYLGLSPIAMMREAVGLSLATEGHGARLFASGARPSGVFSHPGELGAETAKLLREQIDANNSGENSGRTLVLEEGMTWTAVSMTSDDAQFLETRKFQIAEIARAFRVPPHMVGDLERATFSNIEHQGIEFVTHTMRPWVVRWEQALNRMLLTEEEKRAGFYFAFNLNALMRADMKSRFEAYAIGRNWGWLSANDVRGLEDLNDLPDAQGDIYLQPLNMVPAGSDQNAGEAVRGDAVNRAINLLKQYANEED